MTAFMNRRFDRRLGVVPVNCLKVEYLYVMATLAVRRLVQHEATNQPQCIACFTIIDPVDVHCKLRRRFQLTWC